MKRMRELADARLLVSLSGLSRHFHHPNPPLSALLPSLLEGRVPRAHTSQTMRALTGMTIEPPRPGAVRTPRAPVPPMRRRATAAAATETEVQESLGHAFIHSLRDGN